MRYRLPWSWAAFDYRELCRLLRDQTDARFEIATVRGRADGGVLTDRGALARRSWWTRSAGAGCSRAPATSRPRRRCRAGSRCIPTAVAPIWTCGSTARWCATATAGASRRRTEQRVGVGSYEPRDHVREPTVDLAGRLRREPVRYQGNWFPHRLRRAAEGEIFFAGDSAGHCFPLSGEGIRTAFYFGIACGRELRAVIDGERSREEALRRYAAFSASHSRAFGLALRLQWLIPRLPPRALTVLLRAVGHQRIVDRAFGWYLDQAHPRFATGPRPDYAATTVRPSALLSTQAPSSTPSHSRP